MQELHCDTRAGLHARGARLQGTAPPVVLPTWPGRRFVDLVADSLREVAIRDGDAGDALFQLMAHAIVQYLAADVQGSNTRHLADDAMDGVLSLISRDLQHQVVRSRGGQGGALQSGRGP
ncbi:hypothetical protein MNR01_06565 [Lysobacter sp. S4-A87]|uniref:hypothetical protein n=1 Tax=Lysobacter sp. S4-A87 TaxID=2925843 RepID=UPI001F52FA3A|nr:hypothetical protein [Lysobacter sp. S4-A87]UNK50664.1 hypothetical protein MNR01_06565 [Lysobacter sp. S4-A87]